MNEKNYRKKLEFQQDMISRQSEQIETLKAQNEKLKMKLKEKDEIINSVDSLREELANEIVAVKGYKKEYGRLIQELRRMKEIMNKEVYKNRWWIIKFLLK